MSRKPQTTGNEELDRLLDAVGRRLIVRRFLASASRNVLAALLLMLPVLFFGVVFGAAHIPSAGAAAVIVGVALAIAAAETFLRRPGRFDAALYVDLRLGLHERLSSLVSFGVQASSAEPAMLAALAKDVRLQAGGIVAWAACPVSIPRSAPITGLALFCTIALILGAAQRGSAERSPVMHSDLGEILSGGSKYIRVELPPELRNELEKIANSQAPLDAAISRLDSLLAKAESLEDIRKQIDSADVSAEDVRRMLHEQQDARAQLAATLARAAERLRSDEALAKAADDALAALKSGTDDELAAAVAKLAGQLAEQTAEFELAKLKELKGKLAAVKEATGKAGDGAVGRNVVDSAHQAGGDLEADIGSIPLFPVDAALEAKAAVRSGRVPARYRWAVEKYFSGGLGSAGSEAGER